MIHVRTAQLIAAMLGVSAGLGCAAPGQGAEAPTPASAATTATPGATITVRTPATATAVAQATPGPAAIDTPPPAGMLVVFRLDGVDYPTRGLIQMGPNPPTCTEEHVHGDRLRSLLPGSDGQQVVRSEHLGGCGYGPPSFFLVRDLR
jgi:hypothetical protein